MLENRCMYIWHLSKVVAQGVPAAVAKAGNAKLSHLIVKIADADTGFENIQGALGTALKSLVAACAAQRIAVYGYQVPHCPDEDSAKREADFAAAAAAEFGLAGIFVDNEEGASYFEGNSTTARIYADRLRAGLSAAGRGMVMSSHDIISYHPKAYAAVIGQRMNVNAPQVYYGRSAVDARLHWAVKENAAFAAPFVPIGSAFVGSANEGGCATAQECAAQTSEFIRRVSLLHDTNPAKYPGYGFWDWEEAPPEVWAVLDSTPVFVAPADGPA